MVNELRLRASPMRFALLMVMLANAVEAYYVASLGTQALSVFGALLPFILLFDALAIGLGAGASSVYARLWECPAYRPVVVLNSLLLSACGAGGLALSLWLGRESLFLFLGFNGQSRVLAETYLSYWLMGTPFLLANTTACALLRAANRSRIAAGAMVSGALVNGVLVAWLIGGSPAGGMSGAAAAQAVGAMACSAVLLAFAGLRSRIPLGATSLRCLPNVWRRVLVVGLPAAVANGLAPVGAFGIVFQLSSANASYVAAYGIAVRLEALFLVVFYAWSSVAGPVFGEKAAQAPAQLASQLRQCGELCFARGIPIAAVLALLPLLFPLWPDACYEVLPALARYFWWVPVSYGAYGFVMLAIAISNGVGAPMAGLLVSFMRCVGFLLPLSWLLSTSFGATGVFVAISLSNVFAAVLGYHLVLRTLRSGCRPVNPTLSLNP